MSRLVALALLATLVALAGCAGTFGDQGATTSTATPTPTVDTADSSTAVPTTTASERRTAASATSTAAIVMTAETERLSGETRIRAPLDALTAEGINVTRTDDRNVSQAVATELGLTQAEVQVRPGDEAAGTVEVLSANVTDREFLAALQAADLDASAGDIRGGVTRTTLNTTVEVLRDKISAAGLTGGTVRTETGTGRTYILVEVPDQNRSEVLDLIDSRGQVRTVASFPIQGPKPGYCEGSIGQSSGTDSATGETDGTPSDGNATGSGQGGPTLCNVTVLPSQQAFGSVSPVRRGRSGQPIIAVTLTDDAGSQFQQAMRRFGFADPDNATTCQSGEAPGHCLFTVRDGEIVHSAGVRQDLAQQFRSGEYARDPSYVISAENASEAQQLRTDLQAGVLPAPLDLDGGTPNATASAMAG